MAWPIALTATAVFLASSPPATGPIGPATTVILAVLGFNLALILCVAGIVGWRLLDLVDARASDAGARLHLRFVGLFSVAAVAPAVIVALFFGVLVNRGVDAWFSERVRTVVENSATVARSYVTEQTTYISQHVGPMAGTLNQAAPTLADSPVAFGHFLKSLTDDNGFSAAYVLDRDGRILARAESDTAPAVSGSAAVQLQRTDTGDITSQRFVEEICSGPSIA
jgi:two-component system nitrogen regulation sensor histidine kinase NtrY